MTENHATTTLRAGPFDPLANTANNSAADNSHNGATSTGTDFSSLLAERRFDINNLPEKAPPLFTIQGQSIATAGNIEVIHAQAKAGKTAVIGAFLASAMQPGEEHLGIVCEGRGTVIHFDTEQSRYDHSQLNLTALRRAGLNVPPEWIQSYTLTDLPVDQRREGIFKTIAETEGLLAVFIDGVADLARDPNDADEAFALVDRLHQTAIKANTAIFTVLHENPGSEQAKTRGHLGSQLERKAETPLRLFKDKEGITTIFAERARHCHISQDTGPRFAYDVGKGLHLPVGSKANEKRNEAEEKKEDMKRELQCVFEEATHGILSHSLLLRGLRKHFDLTPDGAKSRYRRMRTAGIIVEVDGGGWRLKP